MAAKRNRSLDESAGRELVLTRIFDAPRAMVWKAWTDYQMPGDWPAETLATVTFEEHQDKTRLTLRQVGIPSGVMSEMAEAGWNESLDKLAESLEKEKSI